MKDAIGYLRVSTREQGRSGLGLAAQRCDIEAFGAREGFRVNSWYQDVQTGAGKDALLLRPGLAAALKEARGARCPLMVSRLDRLSRNVHFITGLMEHKVHFVVSALGKDCDDFTLHIYASLAEQERKMMSERIKAALAIARAKGRKFGLETYSKAERRRINALGRAAMQKATTERAESRRVHIEWAFQQPSVHGGARPISYNAAAEKLNNRNVQSVLGGRWSGSALNRTARRLGIYHPPGIVPQAVVQARVRKMWEENPEITAKQLRENAGLDHPVGFDNSYKFLKECRLAAAQRSSVNRQRNWEIDYLTYTRIRISVMLKRHPKITAQQIIEKLGPGRFRRLKWVKQIMNECRSGSVKRKNRQTNRQRYLARDAACGKLQKGLIARPSAARVSRRGLLSRRGRSKLSPQKRP